MSCEIVLASSRPAAGDDLVYGCSTAGCDAAGRRPRDCTLPLTSATVTVAVGTIVPRVVLIDGLVQERGHLCVTLSFDHDIIDGAPAARFASRFAELLSSGEELREATSASAASAGPDTDGGAAAGEPEETR